MVVDTIALEKALRVEFNRAFEQMKAGSANMDLDPLITVVPSSASQEKYGWLGDVPSVKEWIGEKEAGSLKDYDYVIKNKDFYSAFEIDRNEIEDDQVGMIQPRIQMQVMGVLNWRWDLVSSLIRNGHANLAYDEEPFFSNRAVNDNLFEGTGITLADLKRDISTVRTAMLRFKSDTGRILKLTLDTIVCPPELEMDFRTLVESPSSPTEPNAGTINPVRQMITRVIVDPQLEDTKDWYGFATSFPLKPFVFQDRKGATPVLDDTQVKSNRKLIYSAEMRGNAGYGFPQMGVKVVNA